MRPLRPIDVHFYAVCEGATGVFLSLMLVFSPWAFATTQAWSKWAMNIGGYVLGILLLTKFAVRYLRGYNPARWDMRSGAGTPESMQGFLSLGLLTRALALLTGLILTYCFVSALNARATYRPSAGSFAYYNAITWLPHSLDGARSWSAFWNFLALACVFWATRDWLLGKSAAEQRTMLGNFRCSRPGNCTGRLNARLRWLLWLMALNGLLLAIEGIAQRLEGSGRLLFAVKPRVNPEAIAQFGPWAYRANAASYFNLLWPVCLGFWWTVRRSRGSREQPLLLVCAAAMAACPIVATSRGGVAVTLAILVGALVLLPLTQFLLPSRGEERRHRLTSGPLLMTLFGVAVLGSGLLLGWTNLEPRMSGFQDNLHAREAMYDTARPMARDYPVFGTGPGTFATVFQLYRPSTNTYWPAQLHNDWLETRITFGWIGCAFICLALVTVLGRYFVPGEVYGDSRLVVLLWLAFAGCLVHARWDFPFQIYSILFLFIVLSAVLFTVSRRSDSCPGG